MNELLRLARSLRCDPADPRHAFTHRLRIGLAVAIELIVGVLFAAEWPALFLARSLAFVRGRCERARALLLLHLLTLFVFQQLLMFKTALLLQLLLAKLPKRTMSPFLLRTVHWLMSCGNMR